MRATGNWILSLFMRFTMSIICWNRSEHGDLGQSRDFESDSLPNDSDCMRLEHTELAWTLIGNKINAIDITYDINNQSIIFHMISIVYQVSWMKIDLKYNILYVWVDSSDLCFVLAFFVHFRITKYSVSTTKKLQSQRRGEWEEQINIMMRTD